VKDITLENYFSGRSKSNFKDHYGNAVIKQCLGKIAEIKDASELRLKCKFGGP